MAIEARQRGTKGRRKIYSYRVKWRYRGTGPQQSKTVDNRGDAEALEDALKDAGWAFYGTDPEVKHLTLIGAMGPVVPESPVEVDLTTVADAVFRWAHRPGLSDGSKRIYDRAHQRLDWLGEITLRDVSQEQVDDYWNEVSENLSSNTLNPVRIALCSALREFGRPEVCKNIVSIDAEREVEPIFLTTHQLDVVVALATKLYGENFGMAVRLAGTIGLRWGEVFGLQVRHLHLEEEDRPFLFVRQAVKNGDRLKDGFRPSKVKSPKSNRLVPLTPAMGKLLAETVRGLPDDHVVFKPANKSFMNYRTFENWWHKVREGAEGVPSDLRFHDLRHTAAKDMLEAGVPIAYVSQILGHSKVDITIKEYGSFDTRSHDLVRNLMGA